MRFKQFLESKDFDRDPIRGERNMYHVCIDRPTRQMLTKYLASWRNADDGEKDPMDIIGDEKLHDRICRDFGYDVMFARDDTHNSGTGSIAFILTNVPESEFNINTNTFVELSYAYGEWSAVEYVKRIFFEGAKA